MNLIKTRTPIQEYINVMVEERVGAKNKSQRVYPYNTDRCIQGYDVIQGGITILKLIIF